MADFLPKSDSALLAWSANFSSKIGADAVSFGLTLTQATDYATLQTAFADAMAVLDDPVTRSPANIVAKDLAKEALVQNSRALVRLVQATPTVTDFQRAELNITIRDTEPSPIDPPSSMPSIAIVSRFNRNVTVRLFDETNPTSRARPENVIGASIFSFVGDEAPTEMSQWHFERQTSQTVATIVFPESVPYGSKVWITAYWFNMKSQSGPGTYPPISCFLDSGEVSEAA